MVVLQHWVFDQEQRHEFLEALVCEKEKASVDSHHAVETKNRGEEMALMTSALQASLQWRKAKNFQKWLDTDKSRWEFLSYANKTLRLAFDSGQLLKERKYADEAYGHGCDVERMALRERAILSAWSNNLVKYKESH